MSSPFQVSPDHLRRHAAHVAAIAGELDNARQAAETTRAGPEAYGKLCVVVPLLLNQLQAPIVETIGVAARSIRDSADALTGIALAYEAIDELTAENVRKSGRGG